MHSGSIIILFQRLTQSADVELADSDVSTYDQTRQISCPNLACVQPLLAAEMLHFLTCCKGCSGPKVIGLLGLIPSSCDR